MLKKFFSIAAVALLFAACEIVEVEVESVPEPGSGMFTVGASFENNLTKSDISETGVFTWSTGDAINVRSDLNRWNILTIMEQPGQSLGPKFSNANFTTSSFVGSCVSQAAVFPQTVDARIDNETLYIKLPKEIVWNESSLEGLTESTMQADNIMVARFEDGANNLAFKNVGGLFRLTLNNIPVNACKLVFSANQKISGEFAVSTVKENNIEYPIIKTSDSYAEAEGENQVTIKFATVTTEAAKKVFFIPVPVGTYNIGFAVKDANDNVLWEFNSNADNYVARAHMKKMPTLSKITIGGGGEGATNIIVTPTGYSGDVILPNTTSDIQVQMNETAGTISLVYSSAEGAKHPANVYLQALGDIAGLNINLKDSHVELTGNGNTVQIITEVTASTTINTFVVDNKVQIGKKENNVPVGGLTISGGSLELNAPVAGKVTVVYDVVEETVNKTSDKVSININSQINDLEVTSASTQSAPDKIYVTLGASSKVNETLRVPETNCNLYIAPGAQAKTVTTRAEDNTIEGKIESINASGESTIVTITENASFVESTSNAIEASAGATIFVSNSVNTADVETIEDNSKVDDVEEGNINVVTGEIIAVIGSENFSSLEAAVAAAVAAQEESVTIKILKAGEYTLPENISKNLTFDATASGVVVNHTGASAVTTITSGNTLTLKNLALNLDNSFYQGFGTSSTGANAGALVMENCSIDGSLSLFGVSTFRSCTFTANDANAGYYNIWAVYSDATFTGCSFTNTNRAVNVYDPACGAVKTVTFENCSFTASEKKKAAINIHHNPAPVQASGAKFHVVITNCTTSGTWASSVVDTGEPADATVCNSALWMVSDIVNWTNGDITVNDEVVYEVSVAQIGDVKYATIEEAFAAVPVNTPTTITMIANANLGSEQITIASDKVITLELNGKTVSKNAAKNDSDALFCNRGTLTIQDNTDTQKDGTGTGKVSYWNGLPDPKDWPGYATNTITNNGTLTIKSGYVENITEGGYAAYTVDNQTNGTLYTPVFNMEGGKLYNSYTDAIRMFLNSTTNLNKVVINGGILDSDKASGRVVVMHLPSSSATNAAKGELKITGGTILGKVNNWSAANAGGVKDRFGDAQYENVKITISGGAIDELDFSSMANETLRASSLTVTGGTYKVDPSDYVANGYAATQTQNGWVVAEVEGEAQIDNQVYETIDAAITAVPTNGTTSTIVKLLKNTEGKALLPVRDGRKVVLDLLGHNLTRRLDLYGGELTVKNGLVSANAYVNGDPVNTGVNTYYNTFTLAADATIQASDPDNAYSIILYQAENGTGYGSIVNIYGHIVESTLWVMGNIHAGNSVINVKNGAVIDGGQTRGGVAVNGVATLNIEEGATVIGKTAVEVRAGNLNVTGGTIRGTISPGSVKPNANGTTTEGIGIAISQHTTKLPISAAISGGTIEGHTGLYVVNPENNSAADMEKVRVSISGGSFSAINAGVNAVAKSGSNIDSASLSITGGTYSSDPSAYCAPGYCATQSGNNWNVQVKNYKCAVYTPSTTLSGSLDAPEVSRVRKDEAVVDFGSFSNLEAGQVIELTDDVYYNGTVDIPAGVVLDFNGHKLTATKVRGLNGNAILQNTLPYNSGQPNRDAYVNISYEGDVENVEIRGGTYTFNPQTYTPSGIGVVVDGASYDAPGLYFVPSIPEALVYYADYNFISTNLGEVQIGYNGSFGKDESGNISSSAGTFVYNDNKKSESINDAFIFQMNPQEEYATSQSYNDWFCDYVVSVKEGVNGTPEKPGLGLWGMYGDKTVGFGIGFNLAANEKYPLISSLGLIFDYTGIKTTVSTFICGTLPFNNDLIEKTVYVDLCLFPTEGFDSSKVNKDQNYKYIVVKRFEYKFAIFGSADSFVEGEENE